jgi:very-short-patch-repair endonuclease
VIEVGGDRQAERIAYDAERTSWLTDRRDYRLIRFTHHEAHHNLAAVANTIDTALKRPPP